MYLKSSVQGYIIIICLLIYCYLWFSSNQTSLDMDGKKSIRISDLCDCSILISLRNIIDIGLRPIIQNITTDITASLTNTNLFEKYEVHFVFIIGNIFALSYNSPIYIAYTMIIQDEIDLSIELKEKDKQGFIFQEGFCQLLQPNMHEKPYMYDSFFYRKSTSSINRNVWNIYFEYYYSRVP